VRDAREAVGKRRPNFRAAPAIRDLADSIRRQRRIAGDHVRIEPDLGRRCGRR